ncbi:efflux transporter outer membrane subunit [Chitinimonas sp.]|uniref:efflux transporter outer membrane subunit n=1 Tax=Chitinimonas sp. TaxID=1934313 RepID=UPI002F95769E
MQDTPSKPGDPLPLAGRKPLFRAVVLALAGLALGACAQLPQLTPSAQPKPLADYVGAESLQGGQGNWPQDRWWAAYGDAQLDRLIGEALLGSPSMATAQARLLQAEGVAQQRDASLIPSLNANLSANKQKQSYNNGAPAAFVPQGYQNYGRATLDFSYELDFWGKNHAALAAATSDLEAARTDAAQAALLLTTSVASSYADLARLHAERDTAEAALKVRSQTAVLFRERFENGLETQGSVKQAEAKRASAEADLLAADESLALTRNQLAALLGAGPDRGLAIARPTIQLAQASGLPKEIQAELLGRRPDVVAARLRAEAAAKRIDVAHAAFYPNVNLTAYVGVQSLGLNMLGKSGSDIGSFGPAISLPIFNTGHLQGQYRGARGEYDAAVASYDATVTQALHDVADVAVSERALSERLAKTQEAVDAASEAYRIVRNRYDGGLANHLEVLTAEDTLLGNLRQLTAVQSRMFSLDIAMVRALGGGYRVTNS